MMPAATEIRMATMYAGAPVRPIAPSQPPFGGVDKRHGNGADRDERRTDGKINAAGDNDERHAEAR